jgi:hypothetical protein
LKGSEAAALDALIAFIPLIAQLRMFRILIFGTILRHLHRTQELEHHIRHRFAIALVHIQAMQLRYGVPPPTSEIKYDEAYSLILEGLQESKLESTISKHRNSFNERSLNAICDVIDACQTETELVEESLEQHGRALVDAVMQGLVGPVLEWVRSLTTNWTPNTSSSTQPTNVEPQLFAFVCKIVEVRCALSF